MINPRRQAVRVAVIGLGKMGLSHLALFRAHPDVELVAVCDPARHLLGPIGQFARLRTYADFNDLLSAEELDAVVVATPSRSHGQIVRAALDRSLHVFCEKPFTLDPGEGAGLADLASKKGVANQVGYHYRYVGAFQQVHRLVNAGAIGKLHNIRAEAYGPVVLRPKGGTWRSARNEGGGCLYDYASHAIDLMNYMVGSPIEVSGTVLGKIFSRDVDDEVYSTFKYANGLSGHLMANWSDESQRKMSMKIGVWGEGGHIQADRQEIRIFIRDGRQASRIGMNKGWNVRNATQLAEPVWFYLRGEEYSAQVNAFVRACQGDPSLNLSSFASANEADHTISDLVADAASALPKGANAGKSLGLRDGGFLSGLMPRKR